MRRPFQTARNSNRVRVLEVPVEILLLCFGVCLYRAHLLEVARLWSRIVLGVVRDV